MKAHQIAQILLAINFLMVGQTSYAFNYQARLKDSDRSAIKNETVFNPQANLKGNISSSSHPGPMTCNVVSFGAVGDSRTLNTSAIQKAIDTCHSRGGGVVLVPRGDFLSGSLLLKSNVTLKIEEGAVLRGSPHIEDYAIETLPLQWGGFFAFASEQWRNAFIYAENASNIAIEGPGTIEGQGGLENNIFKMDAGMKRPMLIRFEHCQNVKLQQVTLKDPASFTTFFVRSVDINIEGVVIRSRNTPNGDGLDFDGCRRVYIRNCDIDAGDDAIAPKTFHPDWPNEDFEISDCHISSRWCAIRIGVESIAPTRRLNMRNCIFTNCQGGIKIEACEGALLEDFEFSKIKMNQVCQPFMLLTSRFPFTQHNKSARPPTGSIRNVRFSNILAVADVAENVGMPNGPDEDDPFERLCCAVVSHPDATIESISFINVGISFPGGSNEETASRLEVAELLESSDYIKWATPFDGELPASCLYLRHVRRIKLKNVRLSVDNLDPRAFIAGDDVDGLTLHHVTGHAPAPVPGLAKLADVSNVFVKKCVVKCGKSVPILVEPTPEELNKLKELRKNSVIRDLEIEKHTMD